MDPAAFESFLIVEEGKAPSTVDDLLRTLRRMEGRGFQADLLGSRQRTADWLKIQAPRGRSEYKKNVQVVNALQRFLGVGEKFPYPRKKRSLPKRLKPQEIKALLAYGHANPLVLLRNRALVAFALQTGLRRSETGRFNFSDFDTVGSLHVPRPAKNGLERQIPLDRAFLEPTGPFMSWLRARPVDPSDPEAVWVSLVPGKPARRLSEQKVGSLMTEVGRSCGVRASFVRTRHTRATELLRRGVHVRYLQLYLGHADLKSTMVYLEADEVDLEREFRRVSE